MFVSVVVPFGDKKISSCLEMKEKAKALIIAGKHAGKSGVIITIDKIRKIVEIDSDGGTPQAYPEKSSSKISTGGKINALIKQIMVIK